MRKKWFTFLTLGFNLEVGNGGPFVISPRPPTDKTAIRNSAKERSPRDAVSLSRVITKPRRRRLMKISPRPESINPRSPDPWNQLRNKEVRVRCVSARNEEKCIPLWWVGWDRSQKEDKTDSSAVSASAKDLSVRYLPTLSRSFRVWISTCVCVMGGVIESLADQKEWLIERGLASKEGPTTFQRCYCMNKWKQRQAAVEFSPCETLWLKSPISFFVGL